MAMEKIREKRFEVVVAHFGPQLYLINTTSEHVLTQSQELLNTCSICSIPYLRISHLGQGVVIVDSRMVV